MTPYEELQRRWKLVREKEDELLREMTFEEKFRQTAILFEFALLNDWDPYPPGQRDQARQRWIELKKRWRERHQDTDTN
jgi:hypothetical protein